MDSSSANNEPTQLLQFYCRDCKIVFESAPDGTGYEQTPCPACRQMCLTVEFELQEQQRNDVEAEFASTLGGILARNMLWHPLRRRHPHQVRKVEMATIARYETRDDAEADVQILTEKGISATILGEEKGPVKAVSSDRLPPIELQVPTVVAFAAGQLLRALDPPEAEEAAADASEEDVFFPCEDCGEMVSFPGYRRGKVEVCPHCGEYVDVPERSRWTSGRQHEDTAAWATRCPACSEPMLPVEACGASLSFCERCHGVWLAADEICHLGPPDSRWDPSDSIRSTTAAMDLALTCPECRTSSLACVLHDKHQLHICTTCHGAFADSEILNRLSADQSPTHVTNTIESAGIALDAFASIFEVLASIASHL